MVTQRRRRQWVTVESQGALALTSTLSPAFLFPDLLVNMPGSQEAQGGLTIGNIVGFIQVVAAAESTPTSVAGNVSVGLTILPKQTSELGAGVAGVPNPVSVTEQQAAWWWRWETPRIFSDPNLQPASQQWPYYPTDQATIPINIRSMRKIPSGSVAAISVAQEGWVSTHEPTFFAWLRILVLLP